MTFKNLVFNALNKIPYVRRLQEENLNFKNNSLFPAGHFYSTIISVEEVKKRQNEIWRKANVDGIYGIDLNTQDQIDLVNDLSKFYEELPFTATKQAHLRYYFENEYYSYTDGIVLYSMIRHFKPKRIIEVGSGYSSAIMLDTNELFFNNEINLTFIEPYPERLYSLLKESDKKSSEIIVSDLQLVPLEHFEKLNSGDILFIDSTHVVKTGSDVNYILFEILPKLNKGVLIHFHDVFYPFEYPKDWVFKGFNWNEDYFLKAFLMYNNKFKVKLFSEYLHMHHKEAFQKMPITYKNTGGNLWLEKI
jgi:predicted O-methyltransferase YrrM